MVGADFVDRIPGDIYAKWPQSDIKLRFIKTSNFAEEMNRNRRFVAAYTVESVVECTIGQPRLDFLCTGNTVAHLETVFIPELT
ncbi:hypothetical protein Pan258_42850 [Symmachiella dynata]|nr:hypothetical protein Pan258_42850 [Symmachiella dynata]